MHGKTVQMHLVSQTGLSTLGVRLGYRKVKTADEQSLAEEVDLLNILHRCL